LHQKGKAERVESRSAIAKHRRGGEEEEEKKVVISLE